jgi:hypothetical protein
MRTGSASSLVRCCTITREVGAGKLVPFWLAASVWVAPLSTIVKDLLACHSLISRSRRWIPDSSRPSASSTWLERQVLVIDLVDNMEASRVDLHLLQRSYIISMASLGSKIISSITYDRLSILTHHQNLGLHVRVTSFSPLAIVSTSL